MAKTLTPLTYFYDELARLGLMLSTQGKSPSSGIVPDFVLPELDATVARFLEPATLTVTELGAVSDTPIFLYRLLDDPETQTTKTFASLLMVLRAVHHIRSTGRPLTLVTPSSANKAVALRSAVARAHQVGLATVDELSIAAFVPRVSEGKLRGTPLDGDGEWASRNPLFSVEVDVPGNVKIVAMNYARHIESSTPHRDVWYTLDIRNYLMADAVRALAEPRLLPQAESGRTHAHAVSSAYGLLGHNLGWKSASAADRGPTPTYLLVQHLATSDLVDAVGRSIRGMEPPSYEFDASQDSWVQYADPHYPSSARDPKESIDSTFYTKVPPTTPAVIEMIKQFGGDGIVVSIDDCVELLPAVADLLSPTGIVFPSDLAEIREWSLIMAITGSVLALRRGLVPAQPLLVHASGYYTAADLRMHPLKIERIREDIDMSELAS